jgi:hypothetical protein
MLSSECDLVRRTGLLGFYSMLIPSFWPVSSSDGLRTISGEGYHKYRLVSRRGDKIAIAQLQAAESDMPGL